MRKFILGILPSIMMVLCVCSFASCGSDDDDNGGSSSSLVGKTFKYTENGYDGDGYPEEYNYQITFTSSSQCTLKLWGYDYVWDGRYKKESFSHESTTTCSVSGNTITVVGGFFANSSSDERINFTNYGDYLLDGDRLFQKQ